MDFTLSEEQQMLVDTLKRFVEKDYDPARRHQLANSEAGFSEENWQLFAELGLLGLMVPEEFDGMSGTASEILLVMEQFGRGLVLEPFLSSAVVCTSLVADTGSTEQRETILPALVDGSLRLALAALEPEGRFDLWHVATRAQSDNDGFVLDGHKAVVVNGASANRLIVSARTSGNTTDSDGISLFLVDAAAPGVSIRNFPGIDGSRTAEIVFEGVRLQADALLGTLGEGFLPLEKAVDRGIAALCAEATGAMTKIIDITVEYLQTRKQFGKAIGSFQALQHRVADMLIATEQARAMTYCAAAGIDNNDRTERRRAISAAKAMIGRSGRFVAQQGIQLHGGMGMTDECAVGHYCKRLNCIDMTWGNEDHHLELYSELMG